MDRSTSSSGHIRDNDDSFSSGEGISPGIIGTGSFGTALAQALAITLRHRGIRVYIWGRRREVLDGLRQERMNIQYFPGWQLADTLEPVDTLEMLVRRCRILFLCIPARAFPSVLPHLRDACLSVLKENKRAHWIVWNCAKGLVPEGNRGVLPVQWLSQFQDKELKNRWICGAWKGPSFAVDLLRGIPTLFTVATTSPEEVYEVLESVAWWEDLRGPVFVEWTEDLLGLEWVSILKNVYAMVLGMVDARWNAANVRYLMLTGVLQEIRQILRHVGASEDVLWTAGGIGDIALTGLTDLSRNRALGLALGKGFLPVPVSHIPRSVVLEGLETLRLLADSNLPISHFPILHSLVQMVIAKDGQKTRESIPAVLMQWLVRKPLRPKRKTRPSHPEKQTAPQQEKTPHTQG